MGYRTPNIDRIADEGMRFTDSHGEQSCTAEDMELVAGVSRSDPDSYSSVAEPLDAVRADVLVDFTHASAVKTNVFSALGRGVNVVIGVERSFCE
jgi:dihydrodipicolinate reductase